MTRIIIDANLERKLHALSEVAEIIGESGRTLGRFVPAVTSVQYEPLEPQISKQELQRRKQANEKRCTTAEVLAYLDSFSTVGFYNYRIPNGL